MTPTDQPEDRFSSPDPSPPGDTAREPVPPTGASSGEPLPATEGSREEEVRSTRAANRFDIRRLIGGLFVVYGVILTVAGIVGSEHTKSKAAGINVDLWTGLGMLVFAGLMIFWALARPVRPEPEETQGEGTGPLRRAPAT